MSNDLPSYMGRTIQPGKFLDVVAEHAYTVDLPGGIEDEKNEKETRIEDAFEYARHYLEREDVQAAGWDMPTYKELARAIIMLEYPTLLDHAVKVATYQVEIHKAGPGDRWQVLTANSSDTWVPNAIGPRVSALDAYQIEVALRGIVIHVGREKNELGHLDMDKVFASMESAVDNATPGTAKARNLARRGLRATGLGKMIY